MASAEGADRVGTAGTAPCVVPQVGHVQAWVPGCMWNRSPHESHVAKTQSVPHSMHVYPWAWAPIGCRVVHRGHVTSDIGAHDTGADLRPTGNPCQASCVFRAWSRRS